MVEMAPGSKLGGRERESEKEKERERTQNRKRKRECPGRVRKGKERKKKKARKAGRQAGRMQGGRGKRVNQQSRGKFCIDWRFEDMDRGTAN